MALTRRILLAALLVGCSGSTGVASTPDAERDAVEKRMGGVWRLTGYVPEKDLSPKLLLSLQSEKIVLRFDDGRVQSATEAIEFDRRVRIADAVGDSFKLFIEDDEGIEQEARCAFDENGNLTFEIVTEPWRGRGVLSREGPAFDQDVED
jgi:hypothetical protein